MIWPAKHAKQVGSMVGSNGFRMVPKTFSGQKSMQNTWVPWWVPVGSARFRKQSVPRSTCKTRGCHGGSQWVPHGSMRGHSPPADNKQLGPAVGSKKLRPVQRIVCDQHPLTNSVSKKCYFQSPIWMSHQSENR